MDTILLTRRQVAERLGISASTFDRYRKQQKRFPTPVTICAAAIRWRASDIDLWIELVSGMGLVETIAQAFENGRLYERSLIEAEDQQGRLLQGEVLQRITAKLMIDGLEGAA